MAHGRMRGSRKRLADPGTRAPPPEGLPAWVGQSFGVALILGDFFLGRRLVESFDAFSDGGLSGVGDPFAWMILLGLAGWWVAVLGWKWATDPGQPAPMSAGAGLTALVVALGTSVLVMGLLGRAIPALAVVQGDRPNALGIGGITALFLALTAWQWWRLQAGDPVAEAEDPANGDVAEAAKGAPGKDAEVPGRPSAPPPSPSTRAASPVVRLALALLLLPAGWALMAPGDLLAQQAQMGIAVNWQGTLEQVGAAALASVFSAGVGMLLAYGPRVLASRILGEGQGPWGFLGGLWLAHWIRLVFSLLDS